VGHHHDLIGDVEHHVVEQFADVEIGRASCRERV